MVFVGTLQHLAERIRCNVRSVGISRRNCAGGQQLYHARSNWHETPFIYTLWVLDAMVPGDSAWHATAHNTNREMIARLSHAGTVLPIAFGDDRVILRSTDDDGLVSLGVFRIVPTRAGRTN